ncbi:outer membrane beta-barrel protein [Flavihumibacter solisilvae]|uniref:Outer membrane protein beta-barrel domain-containing protein n=1 Tax=Flavihumibacter solisilvae TaxID=1349421 RepID=A0A0C1IWG1_9BACT|nr:outer membrane beta-barrel protein [Flavihumibacter solisilvae]KIC94834.1 hypothetical protein OI18_10280 [Flavihumibacter solisilvae]
MRKFLVALAVLTLALGAQAQTDSTGKKTKKDWSKINLAGRANDHFMIQFGYDGWAQRPDSIETKGIGRHLNIYFMLDFPFKTNPHFSVGLGVGVGSSNIYFDKMEVEIAGQTQELQFRNVADTNHFKKFKLSTTWAELPVELRYVGNPENTNKSWKAAVGIKVGTMINAHTKGKNYEDKNGNTLNNFIQKESTKRYFNNLRMAATARVGYGPFGIYGAYQINSLIKDNAGPQVRPYSIGLTISGL